jgi:hypothetical protein
MNPFLYVLIGVITKKRPKIFPILESLLYLCSAKEHKRMNERFKVVYSDEALVFINSLPQKAKDKVA